MMQRKKLGVELETKGNVYLSCLRGQNTPLAWEEGWAWPQEVAVRAAPGCGSTGDGGQDSCE